MHRDTKSTSRSRSSREALGRSHRLRPACFRAAVVLLSLALVLGATQSGATFFGGTTSLDVTTIDPPDLPVFAGNAVLADAAIDFTLDDLSLDPVVTPRYVYDVDFTGPSGLTVVITATRNTPLSATRSPRFATSSSSAEDSIRSRMVSPDSSPKSSTSTAGSEKRSTPESTTGSTTLSRETSWTTSVTMSWTRFRVRSIFWGTPSASGSASAPTSPVRIAGRPRMRRWSSHAQ